MNILLEKLFKKYKIWEKDKYEIAQIYNFLTLEKKQKLIDNFDKIYSRIKLLKEQKIVIQENTLMRTLVSIEDRIKNLKEIKNTRELNEDVYNTTNL